MSNDAPTSYKDLPDTFATSGSYRAMGAVVGKRTQDNARYLYEKIGNRGAEGGSIRQVMPHAHAAQSSTCGIVRPRDVVNVLYAGPSSVLAETVPIESWWELDRVRTFGVGATSVTSEIRIMSFQGGAATSSAIKFRIKYCLATDSGDCGATVHVIEEADAVTVATSPEWHTIKGSRDGSVSTGITSLTIGSAPSTISAGGTDEHMEIILEARATGAARLLYLYSWRVWSDSL